MDTAIFSWRAALQALARMPKLFAVTMLRLLALNCAFRAVGASIGAPYPALENGLAGHANFIHHADIDLKHDVIGVGIAIAKSFIVAPLAVAVHRWTLFREIRTMPPFHRASQDLRFALWLALMSMLPSGLSLVCAVLEPYFPAWLNTIILIASNAIILVLIVRVALLFPFIAMGGQRVVRFSISVTRHHFWRIIAVASLLVVSIIISMLAAELPFAGVFRIMGRTSSLYVVAHGIVLVLFCCLQTLLVAALAAMGSCFLMAFSDAVSRSPEATTLTPGLKRMVGSHGITHLRNLYANKKLEHLPRSHQRRRCSTRPASVVIVPGSMSMRLV